MIKQTLRSTTFAFAIACTGGAFAQTFSQFNGDTRSAYRDSSGLFGGIGYDLNLTTLASDPDLYINNMAIVPGVGFNSNIDISTNTTGFHYNGSETGDYTFGTAISGDHSWDFQSAFRNSHDINSAVANGVYDFSVDIIGGANSTASNVLASIGFHIDIIQKLDVGVAMSANPGSILEGGTGTEVSMTVTNNMTARNFVSTTWWVSGFGDGNGNLLAFDGFSGDWFNKTIASGASRTDSHSLWHANLDTPIGAYTSNNGVVGGLYNGDFYFVSANPNATVNVLVPEPASFAVLGLGVFALLRRRKK